MTKYKLDTENWNRRAHFEFFNQFTQPYYGVTVKVDCTRAYQRAKELGVSFYSYYLHKTLVAVNAIDNFRYRIENNEIYVYDEIDASTTVLRDDHTFGFSLIKYHPDILVFNQIVKTEIERVKNINGLLTAEHTPNQVHFSALPWIDFTSISEAVNFTSGDSCPKFAIGKVVEQNGKKEMSFGLHVHHALIDGYHVGLYFEKLQLLMNE